MKVFEYGAAHNEVLLFLHGGGLSGWHFAEAARRLSDRYRVVLPILDGHAGSDRSFTSIEHNAEELIRWVDEHCAGQVLLLGGVSLGGQIATEILSRRETLCRYAVIESALAYPMPCTHAMIRPAYSLCYPLIRQRWYAKLQASALHIPPELFEEYYASTSQMTKSDLIAVMAANANYRLKDGLQRCQAKALVLAGGKELPVMKRSAKAIAEAMPHAACRFLKGLTHGEFSLCQPQQYVQAVLELLNG